MLRLPVHPTVDMAAASRRVAKAAVQSFLPRSVVVWNGPRRTSANRIALTFDDGPSELSRAYLDVLDEVGAKATFFLVGVWCARYPDLVEEMLRRGHEVAGHGYTHRSFTSLKGSALHEELERTEALLPAMGRGRRYVRPPRGALDLSSLMVCARMGFTTVLWSLDSADWRLRDPQQIVRQLSPRSVRAGDIVLLHEGQQWTMDALPRVLDSLVSAGFELVTVGELLDDQAL